MDIFPGCLTLSLSVIIPCLNDIKFLSVLLKDLKNSDAEIIVADGGSHDESLNEARRLGVRVCQSLGGRGSQMNEGARISKGDVLLFLHADSQLPPHWESDILSVMEDSKIVGGAFAFAIDGKGIFFRFTEITTNARCRIFSLPYGDQAYFVRKDVFEKMKGYPVVPIMEDVIFWRRLRLRGRVKLLPYPVKTSSRRWVQNGKFWVMWTHTLILIGYILGFSLEKLSRLRISRI